MIRKSGNGPSEFRELARCDTPDDGVVTIGIDMDQNVAEGNDPAVLGDLGHD